MHHQAEGGTCHEHPTATAPTRKPRRERVDRMLVRLEAVTKAARSHALSATTLQFETGAVTFAFAETEQRPTVLGLLAAGRMVPDAGGVLIDGHDDPPALRRRVALVDAPDVSAPEPNVRVTDVVAEELMFAGKRSGRAAARRWLQENDMDDAAHRPFGNLEPGERLRLLCELAAARAGVEGLVVVSPDRHGGDPHLWWRLADEFAQRGLAVLTIAGEASRMVLGIEAVDDSVRVPSEDSDSDGRDGDGRDGDDRADDVSSGEAPA